MARHPRLTKRGDWHDDLDHFLEILLTKPGALGGSTALAQARTEGVFTEVHEAFCALARAKRGEAEGTRLLVEVLLMHRHMNRVMSPPGSPARWRPARPAPGWSRSRPARPPPRPRPTSRSRKSTTTANCCPGSNPPPHPAGSSRCPHRGRSCPASGRRPRWTSTTSYCPAGTGKSHLLIGIGTAIAEAGLKVRYTTTVNLVNELAEAARWIRRTATGVAMPNPWRTLYSQSWTGTST